MPPRDPLKKKPYFGYWCFEAAATSKRLAFDDQDLKNEPYYPYDLAQKT